MEFPKIYLAPMLDVTTPHFRNLIRLTTTNTILFTEMLVAGAVINMEPEHLLAKIGQFDPKTIVQIGGSVPENISLAVKTIKNLTGHTEFNLNCGCPSPKVKKGNFGAILMLKPELVVEVINKVYEDTGIVMSVKIRIGVDENDSYEFFSGFVAEVKEKTKCKLFFVHARKCLLCGLSPDKNRKIPKLNYEFVFKLKKEFEDLNVVLNGGICKVEWNKEFKSSGLCENETENSKKVHECCEYDKNDDCDINKNEYENNKVLLNHFNNYCNENNDANILLTANGSKYIIDSKAVDGFMIGREAMKNVMIFNEIFGEKIISKRELFTLYIKSYAENITVRNEHVMPILNLLHGCRNSRKYKAEMCHLIHLKENMKDFYDKIISFF